VRRCSEMEPSGRIVLECGCGERLVLLGREDDWHAEGRRTFACECGNELTLADRRAEESDIARFFRSLELPHRS
jgi:hypothetical protein